MPKLTKRLVDSIRPTGREEFVWDDKLPGFGLRVLPSKKKTFVLQYRLHGRTQRMALGLFGPITVEEARKAATRARGQLVRGDDPKAKRSHGIQDAFSGIADRWLSFQTFRVEKGKLNPRTLSEYQRQVERELKPRFRYRRLNSITHADAQRMHDDMASRPVIANRTLGLLSQIWRWAESRGYCQGPNPCRDVEQNAERRRETYLQSQQLVELGRAMRAMHMRDGADSLDSRIEALIRLIALTGCRPGEIKRLAWADVDLERQVLHLKDAKTGDRTVWLNGRAQEILRSVERIEGSPWVFPSPRRPDQPVGEFRKPWRRLLDIAGIEHTEPYVLRHTFATESESLGHSPFLTAHLLGHSMGRMGTTGVYVHHVPNEVRDASERIGARISAALDGRPRAEIVRLQRLA